MIIKDRMKKVNGYHRIEKGFTTHETDKRFILTIQNKLQNIKKKTRNNAMKEKKKQAKHLNRHFTARNIQMAYKHVNNPKAQSQMD